MLIVNIGEQKDYHNITAEFFWKLEKLLFSTLDY